MSGTGVQWALRDEFLGTSFRVLVGDRTIGTPLDEPCDGYLGLWAGL